MDYKRYLLKKRPQYLLAVMPGTYISNIIAQWKHRLVNEIGEFGSDESLAHLTILGFDTDKQPLEYWIGKISAFCYNCPSREISFEGFASFGFSIFYIKPDKIQENISMN